MDKKEIQEILQQPFNPELWFNLLRHVFGVKHLLKQPQTIQLNSNDKAESAYELGNFSTSDDRIIGLYHVKIKPDVWLERNKVGLRALLRTIYKYEVDGALIVFEQKEKWRLSFVSEIRNLDVDGNILNKATEPNRYTYLLGKGEKTRTATDRLSSIVGKEISLEDIRLAFSVEALTKEFYSELFNWYQWSLSDNDGFEVTFPNDTSTEADDRKVDEHLIRLITRLMFVWFIKQKKLIPELIFHDNGLKGILNEFDPFSKTSGNYYNAILQNLFFATLNKPISEREFASTGSFQGKNEHYGIKTLFRDANEKSWFSWSHNGIIDLFKQVPFLNGGLFECLDQINEDGKVFYYDGFSREAGRQKRAFIPNCLFFDPHYGLIQLLQKYHFTVEENSAHDVEVALDPELLGKVFENLLGAYNPETKETARKQSGSFYTPREIVNYMVDESIKAYLQHANPELSIEDLRVIFNCFDLPDDIKKNKELCRTLSTQLKEVKILDPACGSGAYPMGILNRMVELLMKFDTEKEFNIFDLKLELIENCVYGVDIQSIAVQIAKLRFFISLICEQTPTDKEEENYGIKSLPNLEAKFVAADTLIGLTQQSKEQLDLKDEDLLLMKNDLWDLRCHKNFRADTWQKKLGLRKQDKDLCKGIEHYLIKNASKPDLGKIERIKAIIIELKAEREKYPEKWIDETVVPKAQLSFFEELEQPNQPTVFSKDINRPKRDEIDIRIRALSKEIETELKKSTLTGMEDEISKMIKWNPYNQNESSPFFDPEWMFGIIDGFDIVIGNPPYIQLQKESGKLAEKYKNSGYETFERTGDIYSLFYERGWQLLRAKGTLCYITSNKWMRAGYGESTRKFFSTKTNPILLIDFAGQKIFESATVDTNILLFQKAANEAHSNACSVKAKWTSSLNDYVINNTKKCKFTSSGSWVILNPIEQGIKEKVERMGTPLKDWKVQINYGIKTGYNEAFIIDGKKKDELISKDPKSAEIIRPILRGRDIKKYGYDFADLWIVYIPWHFPLHFNSSISGASKEAETAFILEYPAIYNHLFNFKTELANRNKAETGISYEWYALQRWGSNYWEDFYKQKIVYNDIAQKLTFALVEPGIFFNNTVYFIQTDRFEVLFLLIFLNSAIIDWYFRLISVQLGEKAVRMFTIYVENIPIPYLSIDQQEPFVNLAKRIIENKKINQSTDYLEKQADYLIYKYYGITEKEIQVIESQYSQ